MSGGDVKTLKKAPERKRASVWATYNGRPGDKDKNENVPIQFFVFLTTWAGTRLAIRCHSDRKLHMEHVPTGGTYLYFQGGLIYVRESTGEINSRIHRRLNQMQQAWVPD